MVLHRRNSPLARLTKSLIAMNGHSESSKDAQQKARRFRRQRRRQARLGPIEVTEESSDEASHIDADRRVPREPIERLVAMMKFLGSYNNEVEQIERALGDLQLKDEKIHRLSITVRELQHSKNEECRRVEEEQRRLEELQSQLNDEETSLKICRQTLDQEAKQLKEEKQQFKAEETARCDETIAAERKKMENKLQELTKQNKKAMASKMERVEQQIRQLQDQVSNLTEAKDNAETTVALFRTHTKELTEQKKELESRYKTQDSTLSEFEEDLSKIHQGLKALAHAYFGELPLEDFDIDQCQSILRDYDRIFHNVPLTTSNVSKYLRVRAAESVIANFICRSLWQRFGGSTLPLSPDQTCTFVQISEALARQDRRKESLWRYLTFQGLDGTSPQSIKDDTINNQLQLLETRRISEVLRVLIPQQKQKDFERDLGRLLTECLHFWNKAKRDSCIIEFDTKPPQLCGSGWLSEPCPELDRVEDDTEQGRNQVQPWCLFPRITFVPVNEEPKIVAGRAVFSDCPAFHEGLCELRRQQEELKRFKRKIASQPSTVRAL